MNTTLNTNEFEKPIRYDLDGIVDFEFVETRKKDDAYVNILKSKDKCTSFLSMPYNMDLKTINIVANIYNFFGEDTSIQEIIEKMEKRENNLALPSKFSVINKAIEYMKEDMDNLSRGSISLFLSHVPGRSNVEEFFKLFKEKDYKAFIKKLYPCLNLRGGTTDPYFSNLGNFIKENESSFERGLHHLDKLNVSLNLNQKYSASYTEKVKTVLASQILYAGALAIPALIIGPVGLFGELFLLATYILERDAVKGMNRGLSSLITRSGIFRKPLHKEKSLFKTIEAKRKEFKAHIERYNELELQQKELQKTIKSLPGMKTSVSEFDPNLVDTMLKSKKDFESKFIEIKSKVDKGNQEIERLKKEEKNLINLFDSYFNSPAYYSSIGLTTECRERDSYEKTITFYERILTTQSKSFDIEGSVKTIINELGGSSDENREN